LQNPILIYGKNGQVGSSLGKIAKNAIIIGSSDADFSTLENIENALQDINPKAIINATAYTNVDLAESEADAAHNANVLIPKALATYCKNKYIPFIHYSTDYIFSGEKNSPYDENDPPAPLNIYGKTKLAGEQAIEQIGGKYLIFRTSWVYDHVHKNFLTTMLRLGREREELSIVSDQIGTPTYAPDLAESTLKILYNILNLNDFPSGIYHLCNGGQTSWYDYANAIFAIARKKNIPLKVKKVMPILAEEYPTPAKRPLNSRLDCSKAKSVLNVTTPDWRDSLEKCMEKIIESN
jgi:dTDP-4-dehydrorhamnose reductase